MARKKLTIADIAHAAGVSRATVSRVLANATSVKPETKDAVNQVIRDLSYSPTALSKKASCHFSDCHIVSVIIPSILNPFWGAFTSHIQKALLERGYAPCLYETYFDPDHEKKCVTHIRSSSSAAVIAVSTLSNSEIAEVYSPLNCSITFLDRALEGSSFNSVIQDNFQAGYLATRHLLELGHHKIAFIAGPKESYSSMNRVSGYFAALKNSFIPIDEDLVEYGEMSLKRGIDAGKHFCKNHANRPHALVIANDETAIGFIDQCRASGLHIPEDVSIVSFDDTQFANLHSFNLTSVHQPIDEMALASVEVALCHIGTDTKESERRILLQPNLIIRGTSTAFHE